MKTIAKNTNSTQQELGKIYLWTAAIHKWKSLLYFPEQKELIINSLKSMHEKSLITIYAYVIMPNHVHIIWKQNNKNGKEMPRISFLKQTARELSKKVDNYGKGGGHKVVVKNIKFGKKILFVLNYTRKILS